MTEMKGTMTDDERVEAMQQAVEDYGWYEVTAN